MNLENELSPIEINLYLESIFYIPSKPLPGVDFNSNIIDTAKPVLDKIIKIDNKGFLEEIDITKPTLFYIFKKKSKLAENLYYLLEKKNELDVTLFNFLLNKYCEQVEAFVNLSEILKNFLVESKILVNDEIIMSFNIQMEAFRNHFNELKENFDLSKYKSIIPKLTFSETLKSLVTNSENKPIIVKSSSSLNKHVDPNKPTLSSYIHHKNSEKFEEIIIKNFYQKKGKTLRCILEYLRRYDLITFEYGMKLKLYNAFKNSANWNIGVYNSMWSFELDRGTDPKYIEVKNILNKLLRDTFVD